MEIKLEKDWRYAGKLNKAGSVLKIKNKNIVEFLKNNGYVQDKKNKKEKKSKIKIAEENK